MAHKRCLFVGINSNSQDDRAAVASHAKEYQLPFVVLKDEGARVADRFAAERTPEAFVLDETRTVRYRGRIDDRYDKGVQRAVTTRHDLADAPGCTASTTRGRTARDGGGGLPHCQGSAEQISRRWLAYLHSPGCPDHSETLPGLSPPWGSWAVFVAPLSRCGRVVGRHS